MVDRVVDPENDIPVEDVDDVLKAVIVAVLDEAADKMEEGKDVIPFTGLAVKETSSLKPTQATMPRNVSWLHAMRFRALVALRHMHSAMTAMLIPTKAKRTPLSLKVACRGKSRDTRLAIFTMRRESSARLSTSALPPTLWKTSSLSSR